MVRTKPLCSLSARCYILLVCSFLLLSSNSGAVLADQSTLPTGDASREVSPNAEKQYIYLPLALSIVPQLSAVEYEPTEVPHLSFNLLAGYYAKLDGFELGGLANLETEEVYGVQLAGLTNVVGGNVKGFQAASGLNLARTDLKGLQVALGANIVAGNVEGFQGAYGLNLAGSNLDGIQILGAANIVDGYVEGAQGSYGFNIARGDLKGLQVARVRILRVGVSEDSRVLLDLTWVAISTACNSVPSISRAVVSLERRLVLSISLEVWQDSNWASLIYQEVTPVLLLDCSVLARVNPCISASGAAIPKMRT